MTQYKVFAPISAVLLAGTVFYQQATHDTHHDTGLAGEAVPLPDDAERRMPKWPDQARNPATFVSTGSMTVTAFPDFDKA